jgi:hypothetical protein
MADGDATSARSTAILRMRERLVSKEVATEMGLADRERWLEGHRSRWSVHLEEKPAWFRSPNRCRASVQFLHR